MTDQISRTRRTLRRFCLGSGPLKRASDHAELASRVLLVLVLLLALPVALTVGAVVYAGAEQRAAQETATRHPQVAVLLADAVSSGWVETSTLTVPTPATWRTADGTAHQGEVRAPRDAVAGDHVRIWVDGAGALADRPLQTGGVVIESLFAGVCTFLGLAVVAAGGHLAVCRALWRSRSRQWEREWRTVEPQWAGRQ
jgi:hypothetical protein